MHAGMAKNDSGQRVHGGKFLPVTVETTIPAGKQNKNARRRAKNGCSQRAHRGEFPTTQSKRPCRRGNGMKYARRHGEGRQRPAGIR
ncbi:MAG: hypothetical protein ACLR23_06200 [Clostridia bacterium]